MVQTDRVGRRRAARREEFLAAAAELAAEDGIEALTMKALADRLDCAVGTAYSYFSSKGGLTAAVQIAAIERLATAYDRAASDLEPLLTGLSEPDRVLARLIAFGRFIVAASREMPHDFRLQQQLLNSSPVVDTADAETVVPVAFDVLRRPQALIAHGARAGALAGPVDDGVAFERAVTWMAAVNGVLTLDAIQIPAAGLFDTALMADRLSFDLLRAWGADAHRLDAAALTTPPERIGALLAAACRLSDQEVLP